MAKRPPPRPHPRNAEEARSRLLVLACLMWRAYADARRKDPQAGALLGMRTSSTPDTICADLARVRERHSLDQHLDPTEATILNRPLGKLNQFEVEHGTWNAEAIRTLAWSLNGVETLNDWPEADQFSYSAPLHMTSLAENPLPPWLRKPVLRPRRELERMRRIAALWTWRYRAHRIVQGEFLTLRGASALMEHVARRVAAEAPRLRVQLELGDLLMHGKGFRHADSLYAVDWLTFSIGQPLRHHTLEWLTGRTSNWQDMALPTPEIIRALAPAHAPGSWAFLKKVCEGKPDGYGVLW